LIGQLENPAGLDEVGVGESPAVRLGHALVEVEQVGPGGAVAELGL
jgi:hypothetical protein